MFEEPRRNHDPRPTEQERAWIETDPFRAAARVMALMALAVLIGTAATDFSMPNAPAVVAAAR